MLVQGRERLGTLARLIVSFVLADFSLLYVAHLFLLVQAKGRLDAPRPLDNLTPSIPFSLCYSTAKKWFHYVSARQQFSLFYFVQARGRLILFEVDYAYLAREDGKHEHAVKLRQVFAKEQLGPVSGEVS